MATLAGSCGLVGYDPQCPDSQLVCVTSVRINGGAPRTAGRLLSVELRVLAITGRVSSIRVAEIGSSDDCQAVYADDDWLPYPPESGSYDLPTSPRAGPRKLCAWARSDVGEVSVIEPPVGRPGIDSATVEVRYQLPRITELAVENADTGTTSYAAGDPTRVSFTVVDDLGLADQPVRLFVTESPAIEESWTPIDAPVNGLAAGSTSFSGSVDIRAPSSEPFRVIAVPVNQDGGRGVAAISDIQNGGGWNAYAGSPSVGTGSLAHALHLISANNAKNRLAVDPIRYDTYVIGANLDVLRIDARTGTVERYIEAHPEPNLPDEGELPSEPRLEDPKAVGFDNAGRLYVGDVRSNEDGGVIYQIDPGTRRVRRYAGGGHRHRRLGNTIDGIRLRRRLRLRRGQHPLFPCQLQSWHLERPLADALLAHDPERRRQPGDGLDLRR